jgi:hypothetical protein
MSSRFHLHKKISLVVFTLLNRWILISVKIRRYAMLYFIFKKKLDIHDIYVIVGNYIVTEVVW